MRSLALLVVIAACGSPRWKPAPGFGAVVVTDDRVLRVEADGSVSASVTVALDADRAVGTVRLVGATLERAASSPHLALARARGWQVLAKRLDAPERVLDALLRGIAEIRSCCGNDIGMNFHLVELDFADPVKQRAAIERGHELLGELVVAYVRRNHAAAL
jgi:hypothetical protein